MRGAVSFCFKRFNQGSSQNTVFAPRCQPWYLLWHKKDSYTPLRKGFVSQPNFFWVFPSKPWPPQLERSCEILYT
jgi:hypothetical protein